MSEKPENPPAFPFQPKQPDGEPLSPEYGMTLLDYFAAHVAQGMVAGHRTEMSYTPEPYAVADYAYKVAGALLRARPRGQS